jgi:uncharacterized protein YjbJ (UPF0337 family)
MNKDQAAGATKRVVGKVQESVGKTVGNQAQQNKGIKRQSEGKVQGAVGDLEHAAKTITAKK